MWANVLDTLIVTAGVLLGLLIVTRAADRWRKP